MRSLWRGMIFSRADAVTAIRIHKHKHADLAENLKTRAPRLLETPLTKLDAMLHPLLTAHEPHRPNRRTQTAWHHRIQAAGSFKRKRAWPSRRSLQPGLCRQGLPAALAGAVAPVFHACPPQTCCKGNRSPEGPRTRLRKPSRPPRPRRARRASNARIGCEFGFRNLTNGEHVGF